MKKEELFKRRQEPRKSRKHDFKTPKAESYLIVTEGKCTEPNYFNGLRKRILAKVGGVVDVIDICGEGASTQKLIEITDRYVSKAKIPYKHVWIVFDKDDFQDFDQAIKEIIVLLGAIRALNIGSICISNTVMRICIETNGMPSLMSCLNSKGFQKMDIRKILRTFMSCWIHSTVLRLQ